jgi:hypothetical protein
VSCQPDESASDSAADLAAIATPAQAEDHAAATASCLAKALVHRARASANAGRLERGVGMGVESGSRASKSVSFMVTSLPPARGGRMLLVPDPAGWAKPGPGGEKR